MNGPYNGENDGATAKKIDEIEDLVPKGILGDSLLRLLQNDQSDVVDYLNKDKYTGLLGLEDVRPPQ